MKKRKALTNVLLISGYLVAGIAILVYLIAMASGGGIFGSPGRSYRAVLTNAPGLQANKSDVLNPAGVRIGVVTGVELDDEEALVSVKVIDGDMPVNSDATMEVVTKTILGEKAVVLNPGESGKEAKSDATLKEPAHPAPSEADEALNPLAAAVDKIGGVDAAELLRQLRTDLVPVLGQVEGMFADIGAVSGSFAGQGESMSRIGSRIEELIITVADHDADITSIVQSLSILTAELGDIVTNNLNQLNDLLVLTSRLSGAVAGRNAEIEQALAALPRVLLDLQYILDTVVRAFDGERGVFFNARINNVWSKESLQQMLDYLKGA